MLTRRTPMKRSAWGRKNTPVDHDENPADDVEDQAPVAIKKIAPLRRGTYSGGTTAAAPKTEARRNPALLELARGRPCLLMVPGVCNFNPETTVACHSNWSVHGKAGARKADDCYSCWGCVACHSWLDQGSAPDLHKQHIFALAMTRQVRQWGHRLVDSQALKPRERAAIAWALDNLLLDGAVDAAFTQFHFRFPVSRSSCD